MSDVLTQLENFHQRGKVSVMGLSRQPPKPPGMAAAGVKGKRQSPLWLRAKGGNRVKRMVRRKAGGRRT